MKKRALRAAINGVTVVILVVAGIAGAASVAGATGANSGGPVEGYIFNAVMAVAMLLIGFLLNRVFNEVDKLRLTDESLVKQINILATALPSGYISKDDFSEFRRDITSSLERIHQRLDQKGYSSRHGDI